MRAKKCKSCGDKFTPSRTLQAVCGVQCAQTYATMQREKKTAQEAAKRAREAREKIKTRQDWQRDAQAAVNRYVRLRDKDKGCISCDKPATWGGQWHASHFRSVGAASAVRFNLFNIHKACSVCNRHLSGNIANYRPRLIEKIGLERVEWLESQNQTVRYDVEYLKRLKKVFSRRARLLERC